MTDSIKVTSCILCPFNYDTITCQAATPEAQLEQDGTDFCVDEPPECCPLRKGPQTVELDLDA